MQNNNTPKSFQISARQGDVYLVRIPDDVKLDNISQVEKDQGRTILAYGEVTGHAHAIVSDQAALWAEAGNIANRILEVSKTVFLKHEEHDPIEILPGRYEIVRQREYHPEAIRYVAD